MKLFLNALIVGSVFLSNTLFAYANDPIASCRADSEGLTLCIYDISSAPNWKSILVTWSRAASCKDESTVVVYSRQFVQKEVIQNDRAAIRAAQNNGVNSAKFSFNRQAGTAVLSGRNSQIDYPSDGPSAPPEPTGKFSFSFDHCQ